MPSYKTIAQILIAISAVGSALAAPVPVHQMHDARNDLSQLERALKDEIGGIAKSYAAAGAVAGVIGGGMGVGQKWMSAKMHKKPESASSESASPSPTSSAPAGPSYTHGTPYTRPPPPLHTPTIPPSDPPRPTWS